MAKNRTGEKIGWVAGWIGGFIWVAILSVVFLFQKQLAEGLLGLMITGVAIAIIMVFAPWKHPQVTYWKLMLGPYGMFVIAIVWAVWSFGGLEAAGLNWLNFLWIVPVLSPLGILSNAKWNKTGSR